MNEFPPVLTAALAAELLQVHVEYLRKLVRAGKVPCHRFPGGRELRFLRDELLEWLLTQPGPDGPNAVSNAAHAAPSRSDSPIT
jgi:excisionase family DNA binding protein